MHDHLRVITLPVDDADTLGGLESAVLELMDPPLNLDKGSTEFAEYSAVRAQEEGQPAPTVGGS